MRQPARSTVAATILALAVFAATTLHAQFQETITVSRVVVDVRVTRDNGEPLTGLTPENFKAKIGGLPTEVLSVTWVPGDVDRPDARPARPPIADAPLPGDAELPEVEEREADAMLYVVFIQTDFARNKTRLAGQMKFRTYAESIIDSLGPEARVAVFSFDSHLKFRSDFTSDKEAAKKAIADSVRIDFPGPPPAVAEPSLARRLDREQMRRAATSERALRLIGDALRDIGGPKTMMLMGWGLGDRLGPIKSTTMEWPKTQEALLDSRTTSFALDTTEADAHDLAANLSAAAKATGGFYASTFRFPQAAVERLTRTLSGHYEIEIRVPDVLRSGTHTLELDVKRRGAVVMAPRYVTGGA